MYQFVNQPYSLVKYTNLHYKLLLDLPQHEFFSVTSIVLSSRKCVIIFLKFIILFVLYCETDMYVLRMMSVDLQ